MEHATTGAFRPLYEQPMEASMKNSHRFLVTSGLAGAVILYSLGTAVFAQDEPRRPINPGLVPNTGQINTGEEPHPWSKSPDARIATPDEAWAAIIEPVSRQPSAGGERRRRPGQEANSNLRGTRLAPRTSHRHPGRSALSDRPFRPNFPSAMTPSTTCRPWRFLCH